MTSDKAEARTAAQLDALTSPVRSNHRFDEAALHEYLRDRLHGIGGDLRVRQFLGGQSNPTFLIETGDRRLVLRKKPPGELLASAHLVDREYRVMAALAGTGVPVPNALLLCEEEAVIGTSFFVMDYVPGRIVGNPALPDVAPGDRTAIYTDMAEVLARLHALDWQALGLADFGKHGDFIARQIRLWTRQYEAARTADIAEMDRLIDWLPNNIPTGDETVITHGDYRLGNMILDPDQPRIAALLDWELATLGHPLADLAYCALAYHLPQDDDILPGLPKEGLDDLGIPSEQAFLDQYAKAAGRDGIPDWPFYVAFALFRLAAICQGVYKRSQQGNAADPSGEKHGALVPLFAKLAVRQVGI